MAVNVVVVVGVCVGVAVNVVVVVGVGVDVCVGVAVNVVVVVGVCVGVAVKVVVVVGVCVGVAVKVVVVVGVCVGVAVKVVVVVGVGVCVPVGVGVTSLGQDNVADQAVPVSGAVTTIVIIDGDCVVFVNDALPFGPLTLGNPSAFNSELNPAQDDGQQLETNPVSICKILFQ